MMKYVWTCIGCLAALALQVSCANPAGSSDGGSGAKYSVTYSANGGAGSVPIDSATYASGASVTTKGPGSLTNGTDQFAGWTTNLIGGGASYAAGASFKIGTASVVLYAVWLPSTLTFTSSGSSITITGPNTLSGAVTIPAGVTAIGYDAFDGSTMTSIDLPSGLTSIGGDAFRLCTKLASITIPVGVTTIGSSAFDTCSALTSIVIPASVTSIGSWPFYECTALASITVDSTNPSYESISGVLFNKAGTILLEYPAGNTATSYAVPSTVTSITGDAFNSATHLQSVTIPTSVTSIAANAFRYCSGLTSVTIPASVTSIAGPPFVGCSKLSFAVDVSSQYFVVTGGALLNKAGTVLIQYPQSATATAYTIPSGVTTVDGDAFVYCSVLKSVVVPATVNSLGAAFFGCGALADVYVYPTSPPALPSGNPFYTGYATVITIHVPSTSLSTYQSTSGWSSCTLDGSL